MKLEKCLKPAKHEKFIFSFIKIYKKLTTLGLIITLYKCFAIAIGIMKIFVITTLFRTCSLKLSLDVSVYKSIYCTVPNYI